MDDDVKKLIKKEADRIRAKIEGGNLYGEPIDPNDNDMMLVAAHCCGLSEWIPGVAPRYPAIETE